MILKDKRIFIVEDNLENRIVLEVLLRQHGATVAFERWGLETVERLRAFAPVDVILLDLMFPKDITGYDIYDLIRAEPEFATTPIVAVSAGDASQAIPKTRAKGFAGYISKPVHFLYFPQQIADIIQGEPVWQASSALSADLL